MIVDCWIIDDEPLALELLSSYVAKTDFLNLTGKFSSAKRAINEFNNRVPKLIFVDIQMPEMSGMEFSKIVKNRTEIVFTTAFDKYALESYRVNATDYLLKPISYPEFLEAAEKVLQRLKMLENIKPNEENSISIKSNYRIIEIKTSDITYIQGLKDYIKIFVKDQNSPHITLLTMKKIEEQLPTNQFVRVHRSFIVNRNAIESISKSNIKISKAVIPIGETYKENLF